MKKWLIGLVFVLPLFLVANQKEVKKAIEKKSPWETKFNWVAYLPAGDQTGGIYGKAWPGMRFEVSRTFNEKLGLQYWAGSDFVGAKGSSKETNTKTKMNLYPVGMGVKLKQNYGKAVDYYAGGGPRYAKMIINSKTDEINERSDRNGVGGTLFSGGSVKILDNLALNGQFDYSFLYFGQKEFEKSRKEEPVIASTVSIGSGLKLKF